MTDINYSKERFLKLILAEQVDSEVLRANREKTAIDLVSRIRNIIKIFEILILLLMILRD